MKAFLVLLIVFSTVFASVKDFKEYTPVAKKIESKYLKTKYEYAKSDMYYKYEFFPITLFPCFCLQPDTLSKFIARKPVIVYIENVNLGIYVQRGYRHVLMAVRNYIVPKKGPPEYMTYTLYFMRQNFETNSWEESQPPVIVTLTLSNRERKEYVCRTK
jgi:hypothetical protein